MTLQLLNTLIALAIFSVTVAAIELTISWNGLNSEGSQMYVVDSAGQLIPLVIGAVIFIRIVYKYIFPDAAEKRSLGPPAPGLAPQGQDQDWAEFTVNEPLSMDGFFGKHPRVQRVLIRSLGSGY